MKRTDTTKFVLRFVSANQKNRLIKLAKSNNNSLNQEVLIAVNNHLKNKSTANGN